MFQLYDCFENLHHHRNSHVKQYHTIQNWKKIGSYKLCKHLLFDKHTIPQSHRTSDVLLGELHCFNFFSHPPRAYFPTFIHLSAKIGTKTISQRYIQSHWLLCPLVNEKKHFHIDTMHFSMNSLDFLVTWPHRKFMFFMRKDQST